MPTRRKTINATVDGNVRVESGAVQFGSDWPGLFLRGDHAIKVAMCIRQVEEDIGGATVRDGPAFKYLTELATLIEVEVAEPSKE